VATFRSVHIETGSGDVTLKVPPTLGAEVDLDTGSGDIDLGGCRCRCAGSSTIMSRGRWETEGALSVETGSGNVAPAEALVLAFLERCSSRRLFWSAGPCLGRWGPARFCGLPRGARARRDRRAIRRQQLRVFRRAAALRQRAHRHEPLVRAHPHAEVIADLHWFRRFRAVAVDLHFPAGDGGGGQGARFEEARRPQAICPA